MHWEALPHPICSPDMAPSDVHLFGQLKEALGGEIFGTDDEIEFSCNDGWTSSHKLFFERGIMKVPERWRLYV